LAGLGLKGKKKKKEKKTDNERQQEFLIPVC